MADAADTEPKPIVEGEEQAEESTENTEQAAETTTEQTEETPADGEPESTETTDETTNENEAGAESTEVTEETTEPTEESTEVTEETTEPTEETTEVTEETTEPTEDSTEVTEDTTEPTEETTEVTEETTEPTEESTEVTEETTEPTEEITENGVNGEITEETEEQAVDDNTGNAAPEDLNISEEEEQKLREVFALYATDEQIDYRGFKKLIRCFGQNPVEDESKEWYDSADKNSDGNIDFNEFCRLFLAHKQPEDVLRSEILNCLDRIFPDQENEIELSKVMTIMSKLERQASDLSESDIKKFCEEMDINGNGKIDKAEFVSSLCGSGMSL